MITPQKIVDRGENEKGAWDNMRLECDCGNGESIELEWDTTVEWPDYLLVSLVPTRYGFFGRIKAAIKILFAKEPSYGEVVLDDTSGKMLYHFFENHYSKSENT